MTTIAFKNGVLAADTRWSDEGRSDDYSPKIWRVGKVLIGACGSRSAAAKFRQWVLDGMNGNSPYEGNPIGNGMLVAPGGKLVCWCGAGPWPVVSMPFYALGSGTHYAQGAMAAGATAEEAVRIASRYDQATGGELTVLHL